MWGFLSPFSVSITTLYSFRSLAKPLLLFSKKNLKNLKKMASNGPLRGPKNIFYNWNPIVFVTCKRKMENTAMCNLSHVLEDELSKWFYCTKLGIILQIQQSTFEMVLLLTVELFLNQFHFCSAVKTVFCTRMKRT